MDYRYKDGRVYWFNPLNAELNPISHLIALVAARHIVHVSRVRVKLVRNIDHKWFIGVMITDLRFNKMPRLS